MSGKVIDTESNTPIPFASVFFVDINTGTITDDEGKFSFSGDLPKNAKLKISCIGYQTRVITLTDESSKNLIITLTPAHVMLDEVIISSTTGVLQTNSITNIETRNIAELNTILNPSIIEAMANIPSVYNLSTGSGISKPVIRGLSGTRVVTYLNGLRIENQQWGGDHGLGITENGIGQVEIIKGPSSLLYGADALGGVVYFTDAPYAPQNTIESFVESRFEDNAMLSKNFAGLKISKKRLRVNLFGSYTNGADYRLPNGKYASNSRFSGKNLKTAIGYNKGNWVLNIRYNYMNNRIGIPGHTHDTIFTPETFQSNDQKRSKTVPAQVITNHFAMVENAFYFNKSDIKLITGFTSNNLVEYDEKVTVPGIDMLLNNITYNLRWKYKFEENLSFILGSQGMFQENTNSSKALETLIPNTTLFDKGIYSLIQGKIGATEVQAGVRFDNRALETSLLSDFQGTIPLSKSFNGLNYSAGIARSIKSYVLRANISSGFRPPHMSELLANGVHHGTLRYEIGDQNLKSEMATQLDFSFEHASDHIRLIANPFYNYIQDYIYVEPQNYRLENIPVYLYKQSDKAHLYGGDIGIHYHPHYLHELHFEHNISYVRAHDENGLDLPLIPQTRFNSIVRFEFESTKTFQINNISIQHLYFLPQDHVTSYETPSAAYQLIHLGMNMTYNTKKPIQIKVGIRNLFNESYIDHLSRLKNIGLNMPGRNIYVSLKLNLNYTLTPKNHSL